MRLTKEGVFEHREEWLSGGFVLPSFDLEKVIENTYDAPEWIHFGAGNIFRAFQANLAQFLLDSGFMNQ